MRSEDVGARLRFLTMELFWAQSKAGTSPTGLAPRFQ